MTDLLSRLPADLPDMDEDGQALAKMPLIADRMAYHTKRLRVIRYVDGVAGEKLYKAKHPEAKAIQVRATTIAFQPKPEGYAAHLCRLVDNWLQSDTALAETNRADVDRLNEAMHPRRFNPDNHFTKPLSATLIGRLADVFAKHGVHLDTSKALSMSNVRAAVKATKGKRLAGRPFGGIGHISGQHLTIGNQSFRIEDNNGHACIRTMVGGSRVPLRLDALAEFIGLIGLGGDTSFYSSIENRIGELAPSAEIGPEPDPLADTLPENRPQPTQDRPPSLIGEQAPEPSGPPTMSERIAALKLMQPTQSPACANGADPLTL